MGKFSNIVMNGAKSIAENTILAPVRGIVDDNLKEIVTTIGTFVVRSVRGKFQRSITFTIGVNYYDNWMEEALYGILYKYNDIKKMGRLELRNKYSNDGTGMYYQLDDGTHNLKYRNYNILMAVQTNVTPSSGGRVHPQRIYTIITYNLGEDFVTKFEQDMIAHRNSLLQIKKDSPFVNIYQDYHEGDGYTYWEKIHSVTKRKLATVYLPAEQKKRIVDTINEFFASKEYYHRHGIAHNLKILLYGPPGPQPISQDIMLANGKYTKMGMLEPDDKIMGAHGCPVTIEDIREYDEPMEILEVILNDGRTVTCTEDHKFPVMINGDVHEFTAKTIASILDDIGYIADSGIDLMPTGIVDYSLDPGYIDEPKNGWLVGYLLMTAIVIDPDSDGDLFEFIGYTVEPSLHKINSYYNIGTHVIDLTTSECVLMASGKPMTISDIEHDYILKYIPSENYFDAYNKYWNGSIATRRAMLQGIMDACGAITTIGCKHFISLQTHTNQTVTNRIIKLARSLGYLVKVIENEVTDKTLIVFTWMGEDKMVELFDISPIRNGLHTRMLMRSYDFGDVIKSAKIVNVRPTGRMEKCRCLHVDDPTHLYMSGEFVPTCNSGKDSIAKMIASEWNRNIYYITGGKDGKFVPNAIVDKDDSINNPLMLISDIDKYPFLISEPDIDMEDSSLKEERIKQKQIFGSMINALDGILSGEDRIIIMTTNHIEKFADVLLRDGRVDLKEEIGYVTPDVFRKYCHDFYNYDLPKDIQLVDTELTIAKLQTDVVFRKLSCEEFIAKHVGKPGKK